MITKRFRTPKIKEGELKIYWGKLRYDSPDILYAWRGDHSMKRDSRMLSCYLGSQQVDPFAVPLWSKMNPSVFEELELRGYDLTTLKFSIMKKVQPNEQTPT
jgi:hypothetical protein